MAAGDFDGDGADDLANSAPFEDLGGVADAGLVHVVAGSPAGLVPFGHQLWIQQLDPAEANDQFGRPLVTGRFSGHTGLDSATMP